MEGNCFWRSGTLDFTLALHSVLTFLQKGRTELPGLVEEYMAGHLKVDEYVTHSRRLAEINDGFNDMHEGECIRCVVDMA